jgi:hypothetical protein
MPVIAGNPFREKRLSLQKSAEAIVPMLSTPPIGICLPGGTTT